MKSLLGKEIPQAEVRRILESLGFSLKKKQTYGSVRRSELVVEVPTVRQDVSLPEDIIEEVGRIAGYDKIPAAFPVVPISSPRKNLNVFWERTCKKILKEAGMTETYNYSFFGEKMAKIFGWQEEGLIKVENPASSEYAFLRRSLLPNLLENIEKNQEEFQEINIFELGKVFFPNQEKEGVGGSYARRVVLSIKRSGRFSFEEIGN